MSDTHLPQHWIEKVIVDLSIPGWIHGNFYQEIIRFFTAWAQAEGGSAQWDPLNTTEHVTDSFGKWQGVDYNGIGVANFNSDFHGIVATSATLLESGIFINLVGSLRTAEANGLTAEQLVKNHESEIKTWGTNPTTFLAVLATTK